MRNGPGSQKIKPLVTTSWDDGHPLDIKLAELLLKYGFRGTFYIPVKYGNQPLMNTSEIRYLDSLGMEIGSHTLTHPVMTQISPANVLSELQGSKRYLEDILGKSVVAFCYPKGRFNRSVRSKVIQAGYRLARTTIGFRTDLVFDPFCMPVSYQFYPHSRLVHIRHGLKEGNISGLLAWITQYGFAPDIMAMNQRLLKYAESHGGVVHFWGHSWEIDDAGLWPLLKEVLVFLSDQNDILHLTNSQVLSEIPNR
jgi:peptidoglycan/xylan/chitin deacetylase (PgdA/CDA1 family)